MWQNNSCQSELRRIFLLTMLDRSSIIYNMNRLSIKSQAQIIRCLVDGNSIRATSRITGVSKTTIAKLLVDVGNACSEYQDKTLRNLPCKRIQCDEVWSFCYSKKKNVPEKFKGQFGYGDVWTWTAICADTKIVPSWLIGDRSFVTAKAFIKDLESRLSSRIQLTTDGYTAYLEAVESSFGDDIDYTMLDKLYGAEKISDTKYSPAKCLGIRKKKINGNPDKKHESTSYVERQNLTLRMQMRRFTRLTNAFSKKLENLKAALALHFAHYNFMRVHSSLQVTPCMAAGITNRIWNWKDLLK